MPETIVYFLFKIARGGFLDRPLLRPGAWTNLSQKQRPQDFELYWTIRPVRVFFPTLLGDLHQHPPSVKIPRHVHYKETTQFFRRNQTQQTVQNDTTTKKSLFKFKNMNRKSNSNHVRMFTSRAG